VSDGDDGVRLGEGIVGQPELSDVSARSNLSGEVEHRRRGVRSDDPMAGLEEVPRQEAAAAAELENEVVVVSNRPEQLEDPRCTEVGMEAEPTVMHERQVAAVIRVR
jgi:hypothetical protein